MAIDQDNTHLFNGFYRGKVENIKSDPLSRDRIQIRVMGLHSQNQNENDSEDGIPTANLPWAEQASSLFGGFSSDNDNKSGISTIPSVGSWVWLFFENGNHNKPVYFATVQAKNDLTDIDSDAPDEITTILTKSGHKITINDKTDEQYIEVNSQSGQYLKIDDTNGDQKITMEDTNGNILEMNKEAGKPSGNGVTINGSKALLTEDFVNGPFTDILNLLLTHMHVGNLGAPTPLDPATIAKLTAYLAEWSAGWATYSQDLTTKLTSE